MARPSAARPALDVETTLRTLYILLAGVFEVVQFYAWRRTLFERTFGIVPAIILAAAAQILLNLHSRRGRFYGANPSRR